MTSRPTTTERLARAAAAALLCLAPLLHAGDEPPSSAAVSEPAPIDVAARWRELYANGDSDAVNATFGVIADLEGAHGDIDAAKCEARAADIAHALTVNTVGLAMWYSAYQCARALHQDDLAEQRLAVFGALSRYAVATHRIGLIDTPIRVLSELDVWAFANASGQQVLYAYYDAPHPGPDLPLTIALWDAEHKRERILRFDFVAARSQLAKNRHLAELPVFRYGVAKGFIATFAKNPGSLGAAAQELQNAAAGKDPAKRIAALENLARDGSFAATMGHAFVCLLPAKSACADASIDLLLPWAEKNYGMALVLLAVAYDGGKGVRRSEDNALKLLKKADERFGDGRGSILFSSFAAAADPHNAHIHPLVRKTIEELAARGAPVAEWEVAVFEMQRDKGELSKAGLAHLRHAADAELPEAQESYGMYLAAHGQRDEGIAWIAKAATDSRSAQAYLAKAYENGDGVPKDADKARAFYAEAGLRGDVNAMLWMANYYGGQPRTKLSHTLREGWLESAMYSNNVPASLALARMYEGDDDEEGGGPAAAAAIYRRLDSAFDNADARRNLAAMLVYSPKLEHDPDAARTLLQRDIDRGDGKSRLMFATMQAHGVWGDEQRQTGLDALTRLGEGGDLAAFVELGAALYYAKEPRRRDGMAAWQRAADKDNAVAINNLAWSLCTSADAELLDGARGLELARKVAADEGSSSNFRDTLAACYARTGDFAQAERIEQGVLDAEAPRSNEKIVARLRGRIADYHAHKPYVEQPEAK